MKLRIPLQSSLLTIAVKQKTTLSFRRPPSFFVHYRAAYL